jgi:deoxyribodipyrimidine photo-lyase
MTNAIWWIRRDMRLADNKALVAAAAHGDVVPLFVVDPTLIATSGAARVKFMFENLAALNNDMKGALVVRHGDPVVEVLHVAQEVAAQHVHITADFAPYGRRRDAAVREALNAHNISLHEDDSPYAVNPGVVRKDDGNPLQVFTPFYKRWVNVEWSSAPTAQPVFADAAHHNVGLPASPDTECVVPEPGEKGAWARWESWSTVGLQAYKEERNRPDIDGTSMLSPYLRFGVLHPRQLLSQLGSGAGADHFRSEICWREFYADVLFHKPHTAWQNLQQKMNALPVDTDKKAQEKFAAFTTGQTGYPIVDAGIRQMLATGWMHNRVRMIVASFLIKDLHLPWQWGARFFMDHLIDGDIASNNHGWQWTAGTGTDAAPYYRVFNPFGQGEKFDPDGTYVRQWVPELADIDTKSVQTPWTLGLLAPEAYPAPIVDHAVEREEALARYKKVTGK